ncbi:helix-turn-helix domain-containing protein [Tomitella fengzijianii]|uniref:Helix-turn-helix transcriptional regulator n=1 Tax=Tomitella fengzijianii TaxID=2597660 RepID=A0A516X4Y7_9ACTN|nr:helix-turn-helix transcriptional regulator [Tomitella fengzijianii]QDQ98114.1 helix-turn-helix transcriptional regulator [Tomitella fengzijianii]
MDEATGLPDVVGRNAQAIRMRADAGTEAVAQVAREYGLRWSDSRVSALEKGKVSPTLPTLFALAQALGDVTGERISIADLVEHDGWVRLNADLDVRGAAIVSALRGEPLDLASGDVRGGVEELQDVAAKGIERAALDGRLPESVPRLFGHSRTVIRQLAQASGVAEERAAKSLGLNPASLAALSYHLWGRTLSEERDRRVGEGANAQHKGQVTRELRAELKAALDGDDQ